MTLKACEDCRMQISDAAKSCPRCGKPRPARAWMVLESLRTFIWRHSFRFVCLLTAATVSAVIVLKTLDMRRESKVSDDLRSYRPDSTIKISSPGESARYKYLFRSDDRDLTDIILKRTRYDSVSFHRYAIDCNKRSVQVSLKSSDSAVAWNTPPSQHALPWDWSFTNEHVEALLTAVCDPDSRRLMLLVAQFKAARIKAETSPERALKPR